jgi:MFS family permease
MSISEKDPSKQIASNISRYFLYTAIKGFSFGLFAALWVIYLQEERGLTLSQAALIDVTFFVAAAFGEVPTGIVADTFGRKTSLAIGTALMGASSFAWVLAPTLPLIMVAYISLGIGFTFLSGAEDALFYESVQMAGRGDDYTRLIGRVGATMTGALAIGSVASGLLASIALPLPFLLAASGYLIIFGIVLTLQEPSSNKTADRQTRVSYKEVLRQSFALLHARPTLRYSVIYLSIVPLAALILETLFVQPQALALGIPIAGVGVVIMGLQITNIAGASWSDWLRKRLGERRFLYTTPPVIVTSLILLAMLQVLPALFFIVVISFVTAAQRPIVLSNIQNEVSDKMRATLLSLMSLMGTVIAAIAQPTLGFIADQAGLPSAYVVLASSLGILTLFLFWASRRHFPQAAVST